MTGRAVLTLDRPRCLAVVTVGAQTALAHVGVGEARAVTRERARVTGRAGVLAVRGGVDEGGSSK